MALTMPTAEDLGAPRIPQPVGAVPRSNIDPQAVGAGLEDLGHGMQSAANDLYNEQQKINGFRAEDAHTKLVQAALDLNEGQNGFSKLHGAAVVEQPTLDNYMKQFDAKSKEIAGTLANDQQRQLFDRRSNITRLQFQQDLLRHIGSEGEVYAKDVFTSGVSTEQQNAAAHWMNPSDIAASIERINRLVSQRADHEGLPPDARKALTVEAVSGVHQGVINGMLSVDNFKGATQYLNQVRDQLDPKLAMTMEHEIKNSIRAGYVDQEHQRTMLMQQREDADRKYQNDWLNKLDASNLSAKEILQSLASPNVKEHFINMIQAKDREELKPVKTDPQTFNNLLSDIHNGKLSDESEIYQAQQNGLLSFNDMKSLRGEFEQSRDDVGNTLQQARKDFDSTYRRVLDKTVIGMLDPSGPIQWYLYNRWINDQITEYRKQGKDPAQLFQPSNKDFVGNALPMFQRTPQQIMQDQIASMKLQAPVTIKDDADYDKLPSGAIYVGPDGIKRRKP